MRNSINFYVKHQHVVREGKKRIEILSHNESTSTICYFFLIFGCWLVGGGDERIHPINMRCHGE